MLRAARAAFNRGVVYIYGVDSHSLVDVRSTIPCLIAPIDRLDDRRHLPLMRAIYPDWIEDCLAMGGRCYLATLEGRVIGFAWLTDKALTLDCVGWHEELRKGTELIHSCGVDPEFRGRRVFPYLLSCIARERLDAGANHIWVEVDRKNHPSRRGIERVGFSLIRAIHWHLVLGTARAAERSP